MSKRRIYLCTLMVLVMCFATGCGDALYTLTDEEEQTIVLYSAKMVSKFNKFQTTGVCNATIREGELPIAGMSNIPNENMVSVTDPDIIPTDTQQQTSTEPADNPVSQPEVSTVPTTTAPLDTVIGMEGLDLSITNYEVSSICTATDFFELTCPAGYSYLVLHLDGTNTTGSDMMIDGFVNGNKYTLTVDGVYKSNNQTTVLLNDLATYKGTIAAGDTKEFVLVFQYKTTQLENFSTLSLMVTSDRGTANL